MQESIYHQIENERTLKLEYAEFVAKGTQGNRSFAPNQTGIFLASV